MYLLGRYMITKLTIDEKKIGHLVTSQKRLYLLELFNL